MSIQSNINAALGTVEGIVLNAENRAQKREKAEQKELETMAKLLKSDKKRAAASPAASDSTPTGTSEETTAEAENAKNEPSGASESQVADIIISGNRVAGAIAAGRLAAARQARIDTARAPRDRLAEIRKISRESKAEMRGIKHQERIVRHELEKAKGGNT